MIPFNIPPYIGKELDYIKQAIENKKICGDGEFTKKCNKWIEEHFSAKKALLTTSCTSALEMAAILCDIKPGDEVIMPSYTFVSTADAFVARGAKIVFVDIRPDTLNIDENIHYLLADIIIEARKLFDCRLDDPYLQNMPLSDSAPAGSEQLIRLYLENMLIHLTRKYQNPLVLGKASLKTEPFKASKNKGDIEIFNRVSAYLGNHINEHISIEQICRDNLVGRSQLQKIFKEQCDLGIIEYFSPLKINASKELIRTRHMNFTQIAEQLGYTSIHYFSRQFKKITGMTPSEYASSVKAVADGSFEEN